MDNFTGPRSTVQNPLLHRYQKFSYGTIIIVVTVPSSHSINIITDQSYPARLSLAWYFPPESKTRKSSLGLGACVILRATGVGESMIADGESTLVDRWWSWFEVLEIQWISPLPPW